jgi:hypothetical protein
VETIVISNATKAASDRVDCCIDNLKALLSAADDKVRFYLMNKTIFGNCSELVWHYALELQTLLSIAESCVFDMERAQDSVSDAIYGIQKEVPAHE